MQIYQAEIAKSYGAKYNDVILFTVEYYDRGGMITQQKKIDELLDIKKLQNLIDSLYITSKISSKIVSVDNEIVASSGLPQICTDFFNKIDNCNLECRECTGKIIAKFKDDVVKNISIMGIAQECENNLTILASPITADGKLLGIIVTGQFFSKSLTKEEELIYIQKCAKKLGFINKVNNQMLMTQLENAVKNISFYEKERVGQLLQLLQSVADAISGQCVLKKHEIDAIRDLMLSKKRVEGLLRIADYQAKSLQDLLDNALAEAILLTDSKIGYVYLYSEKEGIFRLNSWSNEVMKDCSIVEKQTIYQLEKTGIWGETVRQRTPIVVNDFDAENPLKKGYPAGHVHLNKFLTIPVFYNDEIVAVVGVANKIEDYIDDDINQLSLMMSYVWEKVEQYKLEEEKKKMQNYLIKTSQLTSLGTFAMGIAHEINNPLTIIQGNIDIMRDKATDVVNGYLDTQERAVGRIEKIIGSVKTFADYSPAEIIVLEVHQLIDELLTIYRPLIKRTEIQIITNYNAKRVNVVGNANYFKQMILNIIINAKEALEESDNRESSDNSCRVGQDKVVDSEVEKRKVKTIEIETRCNHSNQLEIEIKDNGIGMDKSIQEKIFTPFFTTKAPKQSGLGLSIVHSILEDMDGDISVASTPGKGTSVVIKLQSKKS